MVGRETVTRDGRARDSKAKVRTRITENEMKHTDQINTTGTHVPI